VPLAFKGVSDYIEEKLAAKGRVGDRSALQGIEAFKRGAAAIDGGSIRLVSGLFWLGTRQLIYGVGTSALSGCSGTGNLPVSAKQVRKGKRSRTPFWSRSIRLSWPIAVAGSTALPSESVLEWEILQRWNTGAPNDLKTRFRPIYGGCIGV